MSGMTRYARACQFALRRGRSRAHCGEGGDRLPLPGDGLPAHRPHHRRRRIHRHQEWPAQHWQGADRTPARRLLALPDLELELESKSTHELGVALLFIARNPGVAAYIADRVAVMHAGRIVEQGTAEAVLQQPQHEYTRTLLAAVPRLAVAA